MNSKPSLNITLPTDMAKLVQDKVASGAYASELDVLRAGLSELLARDEEVDDWLKQEVVPTFDRVVSGEEKLLSSADVFEGLAERYRAKRASQV